ncbi:MAG: HesA/MoeB/ThiF family protein [Clostridiales bacterium]|nr:HesA/MoeB/ThiF family protein [Clostridiales bacterium]
MIRDFTRYSRNVNAFSREEVEAIRGKSVCVVGCGGLGGYAAMCLARFGVGRLTLVDGDVFDASNLNRQLFCTERNLGKSKALEAKEALAAVNSEVEIVARGEMLTAANSASILSGCDAAVDCLDSASARLILEAGCEAAGIPLVHGAIGGFYGQVCCIFPGDGVISALYGGKGSAPPNNAAGNPPFTPQMVAAIQCSEALKLLAGREDLLRKKLLIIDLLQNSFFTIDL